MKRFPILLSLLALIALSASIAYWVLQLYQPPQRPLAAAPQGAPPEPAIDAAATLFGGQAAAAVAANYQLTGVVAAGRESVAIIVAEGAPPKALVVGKEISPGVTVSEVHPRYVMLSDSGVMKRIDLAPDTKAAAPMNAGAVAPGAEPQGEPQSAPGAVQQEAEAPVQEAPPAPPAPAPVQPPVQPPAQAPLQAQPAPSGAVQQAVPPPAPVQMPPPVRSVGSPVAQPSSSR
jgi:general secretion pathway protein C